MEKTPDLKWVTNSRRRQRGPEHIGSERFKKRKQRAVANEIVNHNTNQNFNCPSLIFESLSQPHQKSECPRCEAYRKYMGPVPEELAHQYPKLLKCHSCKVNEPKEKQVPQCNSQRRKGFFRKTNIRIGKPFGQCYRKSMLKVKKTVNICTADEEGAGSGPIVDTDGGSSGDRGERRPFNNSNNDFDAPINKKAKMGMMNPEQRIMEKIRSVAGPTADLPPKKYETKKFLANTRLYIGNISNEATEAEVKEMFAAYGEIDELFLNREKNFAFLKLDSRLNAEIARAELDQKQIKGHPIKVRFAPTTVRVKVKNLSAMVSNELLELAFSVFGEIERALVFVDGEGKSLGEGLVDFTRKNNALAAHKFCQEKCYFITSEPRPVVTEIGDMYEFDAGLLEVNMAKRECGKNRELLYYKAREKGPRIAEAGAFEEEYATKWKALIVEYLEKEKALKEELVREIEKLAASPAL